MPKPGKKTSEFWITMALLVVGGILEVLGAMCGEVACGAWFQPVSMIGGVILQVGAGMGYSHSRGQVKAAAMSRSELAGAIDE